MKFLISEMKNRAKARREHEREHRARKGDGIEKYALLALADTGHLLGFLGPSPQTVVSHLMCDVLNN